MTVLRLLATKAKRYQGCRLSRLQDNQMILSHDTRPHLSPACVTNFLHSPTYSSSARYPTPSIKRPANGRCRVQPYTAIFRTSRKWQGDTGSEKYSINWITANSAVDSGPGSVTKKTGTGTFRADDHGVIPGAVRGAAPCSDGWQRTGCARNDTIDQPPLERPNCLKIYIRTH